MSHHIIICLAVLGVILVPPQAGPAPLEGGASPVAADTLIQLRLAQQTPATGLTHMTSRSGRVEMYVASAALVADPDIEIARADRTSEGLVLDLRLTPDGARRLAEAGERNVGRHLAVLIGGRLVSAAQIIEPTPAIGLRLQVAVDLPEEAARRVAARVAEKWPERGGP